MIVEKYFTSHDQTRLYYNVVGHGRPLLLCDGLGCDQYIWKYLAAYFQQNHRIIRWNYRGHGRSQTPQDLRRMRVQDIRRDLLALIAHEDLRDVVLVGHSMGVQVVLDFYLHHPERVSALVATCGGFGRPLLTFHDVDLLHRAFPALNALAQRYPRLTRRLWRGVCANPLSLSLAMRLEVNGDFVLRRDFAPYFEHLARMNPFVFLRLLEDLGAHDLAPRLGEIAAPTLIVAGSRDTFTPAWLSIKMHEKIPGSELLLVQGGSHVAMLEFAELANLRIEKFLRERVPPAAYAQVS